MNAIHLPTLLINEHKVINNIRRMHSKASSQNITLRPHFKTHQSALIGEWFKQESISSITVSSVDMAVYFAENGWQDITIAFPVNWRQIDILNKLAAQVNLGLLVESIQTVDYLENHLKSRVGVWIKVDVGANRTGIAWDAPPIIESMITRIQNSTRLELHGLLTHAGQTYGGATPENICGIYQTTVDIMVKLRDHLANITKSYLKISVGDTPGCSICDDLGAVDEIRPGNFVFFDIQQLLLGSCTADDIGVVVACPIVALHPERQEIVVYGGAVHFSTDFAMAGRQKIFGYVSFPEGRGWGEQIPGAYVKKLSQEHGIIRFDRHGFDQSKIGSLVCVYPAHSCLTVSNFNKYYTLDGQLIPTMNAGQL